MSKQFEDCVNKNKLVKFARGKEIAIKKYQDAVEDLDNAKDGNKRKKYKWATIQSYYSMFNAGNALLMKKGWREKNSHYCLIIGLKELYVKTNELDISFIDALQKGKVLRESANYQREWTEESCKELLVKAEEFIGVVKSIIT